MVEVMSYNTSPLERSRERKGNKYHEHLVNVKLCPVLGAQVKQIVHLLKQFRAV